MSALAGTPGSASIGLIAATPAAAHDGAEAIAAAGGAVAGPLDVAAAAAGIAAIDHARVILVEAGGAEPALLEALLDRVAAWQAAGGVAVVVFDGAQLDLVAAAILGGRSQLLCEPGPAERVAALMLALAQTASPGPGHVREEGPEGESERLKRLNEEVARIAEVLARLSRGEGRAGALGDRRLGYAPEADDGPIAPGEIRAAIRTRRLRDQFFEAGLFEDPAWDMLLDLFAAALEGQRVSVSSLCIAAAVAPTTALRWIGRMTDLGLFAREPDPLDRRRAFMRLSDRALLAMRGYWLAVRRSAGPAL